MLNNVVIMGRLTATPELKVTNTGVNVTTFTVAVDRSFKGQNGERETDFINCVAWRNTAEFISRYFEKGSMIAVQGAIQTRKYEDKQGNKRAAFEVVAEQVSFCGGKNETSNNTLQSENQQFNTNNNESYEPIEGDDKLPF